MSSKFATFTWPPAATDATGPLAGIRILDLTAFAVGPWAASLLAMMGADVVKVDPPYGDPIRNVKPDRHGEGTTFTSCNVGKRSIKLDLKDPDQLRIAQSMAAQADVVMENSREGAMTRLGLGYDTLSALNPGLVYCSSSSFGSTGPMAAVGSADPHGAAFSGFVSVQGDAETGPEFTRHPGIVDLGTSLFLVQEVLIGLYKRTLTGVGSVIRTSQMEGALALQTTRIAQFLVGGQAVGPLGSANSAYAPSDSFYCRDRSYLMVSAPDQASWERLCDAIDLPGLKADSRYADNRSRVANRTVLTNTLRDRFGELDSGWWRNRLAKADVPYAVQTVLDDLLLGDAPAQIGSFLNSVPHPVEGDMLLPRPPWRFSRTPAQVSPAPTPGEDDAEFISADVSYELPPSVEVVQPEAGLPLAGLRVVEVAQGISGPYCTWLLGALGAEVSKVEPVGGDFARAWAPVAGGDGRADGDSAAFRAINRGKRSVGYSAAGLAALLAEADIVVLDSILTAFGDGIDEVVAGAVTRDELIVCRIAPLDADTPRALSELEVQALAGMPRYLGTIGERPVRMGADIGGIAAGAVSTQAVLAALLERRKSGLGQTVDVSAVGSLLSVLTVQIAALDNPDAWNGFHLIAATKWRDHGVVTADGGISFGGPQRDGDDWNNLLTELGAAALIGDKRFSTAAERTPRIGELNVALGEYVKNFTTEQVLDIVHRNNALGVPIQTYAQYFQHPQALAMDVVDTDGYTSLAPPWRINGERVHVTGDSPPLGD